MAERPWRDTPIRECKSPSPPPPSGTSTSPIAPTRAPSSRTNSRTTVREAFCTRCGEQTPHTRTTYRVPHAVHLVITLLTCVLWLPVWFFHTVAHLDPADPFFCNECGAIQRHDTVATWKPVGTEEPAVRWDWAAAMQSRARQLRQFPGEVDESLKTIAGEGNVILYRFFQVFILGLVVGNVLFLLWLLTR